MLLCNGIAAPAFAGDSQVKCPNESTRKAATNVLLPLVGLGQGGFTVLLISGDSQFGGWKSVKIGPGLSESHRKLLNFLHTHISEKNCLDLLMVCWFLVFLMGLNGIYLATDINGSNYFSILIKFF